MSVINICCIMDAIKNSKCVSSLSRMSLLSSVGIFVALLAIGGVLGHPNIRPERPNRPQRDLKLVHVVMRHGIRAPVSLYPKDPYQGHEFGPNGRGQLTMKGITGAYEFGTFLRERYDSFLGNKFNASEYYAESTGVERAQATLMSVNTGLWAPENEQRIKNDLPWFPVPVFMTNMDDDILLLVAKDCPQYNFERTRVEESEEVQRKLAGYKQMMEVIQEQSGQTMNTFDDIGDIYATMLAEKTYGLTLPTWVDPLWDNMAVAAAQSFVVKAYNAKMWRLKGGLLVKKLLNDWATKVAGANAKMYLYGGHDSTIANLLSALQIFDPQVPNYAMSIFFELSYDRELEKYGLEIYTKNSTKPPTKMQLPGCDSFCPLEDVLKLTAPIVPLDWDAECATDDEEYTPPPFEGP